MLEAPLVALYNGTGGPNWKKNWNWNTDADLSQWRGIQLNSQGRVVELGLSRNNLKGPIPPELARLSALRYLYLAGNKLTGSIPPELGNLEALKTLNLGENYLSGEIPASLGQLNKLEKLDLSRIQLSGPIPPELGNLAALKKLYLSGNQLSGPIPPELGNLTALQDLALGDNRLSGAIPAQLGALNKLARTNLSNNQLSGPIPPELGNLAALEHLDLQGNDLSGTIPEKLQQHPRYSDFRIGLALDGPPLPPVDDYDHAKKIVVIPVVLGYADLASDVYTAVSYYKTDHIRWFVLGLTFALGPALVTSVFFLPGFPWYRRVFVATHLSLIYEAYKTVAAASYSPVLALGRVVEPLFESVPQLLLQLYAMLTLWSETTESRGRLVRLVGSLCISAASLAYAATDVSSVERLMRQTGTAERFRLWPCCQSLTGLVFSRVPKKGTPSSIRVFGNVHPRSHVWICFVYHVLEIVCRFVSLAMALVVIRKLFFLLILYLWISRGLIVWMAAWRTEGADLTAAFKALDFRFRIRLVAMPFLDSVVDGAGEFTFALVWTLMEFMLCMYAYHAYTEDNLSDSARLAWTSIASICMVGKIFLAWVAILPLKEGGYHSRSHGDVGNAVADESVSKSAEISRTEGGINEGEYRYPVMF